MIVETGQPIIFYASFENPDGEQSKLTGRPDIELFLGSEIIFKSEMDRERNRFFLKKRIELKTGNYLVVYSAVDTDGVKLRGEESLTVFEKDKGTEKIDAKMEKFTKLYKGDCSRLEHKISNDGVIVKRMLTKILSSEKLEELLKEGKHE